VILDLTDKRIPSEAKSLVAQTKKRVGGRFVSEDGRAKKSTNQKKVEKEDSYIITDEDRARFGNDSKAFFEWALTKAATRYEASKYAKELMRFQYPTLSSMDVRQEIEVVDAKVMWMWGEARDVTKEATNAIQHTIQPNTLPSICSPEHETIQCSSLTPGGGEILPSGQ
jgi:hypothetical protein